MKNFLIKIIKHPFFITLVVAVIVSCVLLYGTLKWLESYTHHNEAVIVPDVKGLKLEDAATFIQSSGLRYNVIDSVFSNSVAPGAIVEIAPAVGSKVKEGRILFITVNALTSQMARIPEVEDLSFRQAYAILKSLGFESVEIEYVPGVYKDLAIGVTSGGRLLNTDDMVQLAAPLILMVSNGQTQMFSEDSVYIQEAIPPLTPGQEPVRQLDSEVETWF